MQVSILKKKLFLEVRWLILSMLLIVILFFTPGFERGLFD